MAKFRIGVRVMQMSLVDVHIAKRYKAIWLLGKCFFERWYD